MEGHVAIFVENPKDLNSPLLFVAAIHQEMPGGADFADARGNVIATQTQGIGSKADTKLASIPGTGRVFVCCNVADGLENQCFVSPSGLVAKIFEGPIE
jgi:hypothetical protein